MRRGSGKLTATLGASAYRISVAKLPDGPHPARHGLRSGRQGRWSAPAVTFTLSIPGIPTVTGDQETDADGRASFTTSIPAGADPGQGSATVLVSSEEFGSTQDQSVITVQPAPSPS